MIDTIFTLAIVIVQAWGLTECTFIVERWIKERYRAKENR